MGISALDVKTLRERTGAGMMDCKKALNEAAGDMDQAAKILREKGIAAAARRTDKTAGEGAVCSYIHAGGKYGVLAEINCETDFVARGELFQTFCKDVCLHICSAAPRYVRADDVPQAVIDEEKAIYMAQAKETGKPDHILEKIAEGKLKKWLKEVCLLDQPFVKDPDTSVGELAKELSGKVGEKIEIRRFVRFERGEGIEKTGADLAEEAAAQLAKAEGN